MKKENLLLVFTIIIVNMGFSQTYFNTTASSVNSSNNITHFGSLSLGTIYNASAAGEGRLIELYKPSGHISMRIGNGFGKLSFAIAGANGAFFPTASTGNIIIRKQATNKVIFSLNNTTGDGNHSFVFGDDVNRNTLTILNNGRVGIGTSSPDNELAVKGTIHAQKVKVDLNGWSDFVFNKTYKLPTLQEVERHIKEKGHLKDIPSEKEVVKNGIDLGEMNAKLLQKIEELMLYTIQQQKQIENLQKEIKKLRKRN